MDNKTSRYAKMEQFMSILLLADAGLFAIYLLFAGIGIVWLKAIAAVLTVILSILSLAYLFITKELLKKRSLWMTTAFAAILVCLLFSLVLNYPSVSPNQDKENVNSSSSSVGMFIDHRL